MYDIECVVIAAAGMGSRLNGGVPKAIYEVGGRSMISRQLDLLDDFKDVRIVVGYKEDEVVREVLKRRSDVVFVRNPNYTSTTTLTSYSLGSSMSDGRVLYMDADIIIDPESFKSWIAESKKHDQLIAVTKSKTRDAVYVKSVNGKALSFSRTDFSPVEWANIAVLRMPKVQGRFCNVYEMLAELDDLQVAEIESYEVDCKDDLKLALDYLEEGTFLSGKPGFKYMV